MTFAAVIPLIGLALSAVGTVAAISQANAAGDFQADQAQENAKAEGTSLALRTEDRRERMLREKARLTTEFGAQGTLVQPDLLATSAGEFAREQFEDEFNTKRRQAGFNQQADSAKITASNKQTGSLFDLAGSTAGAAQGGAFDGLFE